jgi:hypothetical protein
VHPVEEDGLADTAKPYKHDALRRQPIPHPIEGDRCLFDDRVATGEFGWRVARPWGERVCAWIHEKGRERKILRLIYVDLSCLFNVLIIHGKIAPFARQAEGESERRPVHSPLRRPVGCPPMSKPTDSSAAVPIRPQLKEEVESYEPLERREFDEVMT